jgi:hypothetical protein
MSAETEDGVVRILELVKTNPAVELMCFELQIVRDALLPLSGNFQ